MLLKNWLNKRKQRQDFTGDFNQQNNSFKKEKNKKVIKFDSKTPSIIEKNESSEKIDLIKRDFVSLLLYGHISKLNDFIPSLFWCEEWLRQELKIILNSEIFKEIFYAWYTFFFFLFLIIFMFFLFVFCFVFLFTVINCFS